MGRQTYPRRPKPGQCDCSLENPCDLHNGSYDEEQISETMTQEEFMQKLTKVQEELGLYND